MRVPKLKSTLIVSAVALGLFGAAGAGAATDTFIKFDGIQGESTTKGQEGSSEVLSWAWGTSSTANGKKGCVEDMHFTKALDSASPPLITNAGAAAVIPKAVLRVQRSNGGAAPSDYLVITMSNVKVSSYQVGGNSSSGAALYESISLSFDLMDGSYKKQNSDGSAGAATPWTIGPNSGKCT